MLKPSGLGPLRGLNHRYFWTSRYRPACTNPPSTPHGSQVLHWRVFSTQPIQKPSPSLNSRFGPISILTILASALLGFGVAKWRLFEDFQRSGSNSPQFGSPQDIRKAIEELHTTFKSTEKVSTDPDDLHDHGFSANDHHPGEAFRYFFQLDPVLT